MAQPIFETREAGGHLVVAFEIPGGVTSPAEFAAAVVAMPDVSGQQIVLLNGRGPVWGYCMLTHAAHATPAVATYDPRAGGYVVVESHSEDYKVGDVLPDPEL